MNGLWIVLGIVVLLVVFADVFLATMNYNEGAFLHPRVCALAWKGMRGVFRRLRGRARDMAFRQVVGIQILLVLLLWVVGAVLGYGLIFYGLMDGLQASGPGLEPGPFAAFYYSFAQFVTVGSGQLTPASDALRVLSIVVTLTGLAGVSLFIAFLLENFQVLRDLSMLTTSFSNLTPTDTVPGDPVGSLAPYYPRGCPVGLDTHLQGLYQAFTSYGDGLRRHHIVYWSGSGGETSSLAYLLHMLGGVIGALRWGLPAGTPGSDHPLLHQLSTAFDRFVTFLAESKGWTLGRPPDAVDNDEFVAAMFGERSANRWLSEFLGLNRGMVAVARLDSTPDPRDAYARYREWLPFAYRAHWITEAVSRDLDYRPLLSRYEEDALAARKRSRPGPLARG